MFTRQLHQRRWFLAEDDGAGSGGSRTGDDGKAKEKSEEIADFETWLKTQPEAAQKAHEKHLAGLKSALDAERKAKKDAEKAAREAADAKAKEAEAALEHNKEFEKLATERKAALEEREAKLQELTPQVEALKQRAEAAETALAEHVENEFKALRLDAAVTELLEGKTPVEKLQWLTKHKAKLAKPGGTLPGSPPGDAGGDKLTDEQRRQMTARSW